MSGIEAEVMRYLLYAFAIGVAYTKLTQKTDRTAKDLTGVAGRGREDASRAQRRWLQDLATDLDEVDHSVARKVAKRLREEAWRS